MGIRANRMCTGVDAEQAHPPRKQNQPSHLEQRQKFAVRRCDFQTNWVPAALLRHRALLVNSEYLKLTTLTLTGTATVQVLVKEGATGYQIQCTIHTSSHILLCASFHWLQ